MTLSSRYLASPRFSLGIAASLMSFAALALSLSACGANPSNSAVASSGGESGALTNGSGGSIASASGGSENGAGGTSSVPSIDTSACDSAALVWKTARKTHYTSYPDTSTPEGYEECYTYNGCEWAGWFAGCQDQQSEEWVKAHNIAALFPDFGSYDKHDICIRSGDKTMIVTVYDTCGDSDCDGCCTRNKGSADALVDLESHTNDRWGLPDGSITWADLGPTPEPGCN